MAKQLKTGIVMRDRALHWTTMQQGNKGEFSLAERQSSDPLPLKEEGEDERPFAELFEANAPRLKGELHYALPAHQALLRVMDLPTHEEEEIAGMVEFQIDKVSPFPVDHMYLSWEMLDTTEDHTRVLVAATQRKFIDTIGEACRDSGLTLHRVDVDLLCWIYLLREAKEIPTHGRHIVVLLEKAYANLVILDHGTPFLFRSLGEIPADGMLDELIEEIEYTLTSTETEWGDQEYVTCTLWHWGQTPRILDRLEEAAGGKVHTRNLSSLPDLHEGVALRATREEKAITDLAPLEWKEAEEGRQFRRKLIIGSAAVLGLWLVTLIAFFTWVGIERKGERDLIAEKDALAGPAGEVRELQNRVAELSQYTDRTHTALECLREIIVLMPADVELSSLNYFNDSVKINSHARQKSRLNQFYKGLSESELFIGLKDDSFDGNKMSVTALLPLGDDS
jgi:hypothetical protein